VQVDGTYRFRTALPVGAYAIRIDAAPGEPGDPGALSVPQQYRSTSTSGLQYDVRQGDNAMDIELR
jgi:hypothetical protein